MGNVRRRIGTTSAAGAAFLRRHELELAIGIAGAGVGIAIWARLWEVLGAAIVFAAVVGAILAVAFTESFFRARDRERRDEDAAQTERELAEMRRIAQFARGVLLESELWRDVDAWQAYTDGQRANPGRELPPVPPWTVAAIVARGREALEPAKVRGWSTIAQALRSNATRFQDLVDQEFPGPPAERRSELRTVFKASDKAAESADWCAEARSKVIDLAWGVPPEERRTAEDALKDAGDMFFGALEWIVGSVEQLEGAEPLARAIAASED